MIAQPLLATSVGAPAGELAFVLTPEDGVVRVAGFTPVDDVASRLPPALADRGVRSVALLDATDHPVLAGVVRAVERYAAGDLTALDEVPVAQPGGPFFQRAWAAMRAVPAGATATYTEIAASAGSPMAVRAAGSACARNLVAAFVPCHRVLRSGGLLGAYLFGQDVKRALLTHEGVPLPESRTAATGSRRPAPAGGPA